MRTDIWAELPSPVKTEFRSAFRCHARQIHAQEGLLLTDYIPARMGAHMRREDYLIYMPEEELPQCYISTAFGECSTRAFSERLLKTGLYSPPELLCFFSELLVIDKMRLGKRPMPESFAALADPVYRGELCLIGNRGRADPLLPLYLYKKQGKGGVERLMQNVGALAGPSMTIRSLGKTENRYGSLFMMPALFARICENLPELSVFCPDSGALAEPILLFWRKGIEPERERAIRRFFQTAGYVKPFRSAHFLVPGHPVAGEHPIDPCFVEQRLWTEELELLRAELKCR